LWFQQMWLANGCAVVLGIAITAFVVWRLARFVYLTIKGEDI
jgi:hypothetical protein